MRGAKRQEERVPQKRKDVIQTGETVKIDCRPWRENADWCNLGGTSIIGGISYYMQQNKMENPR